MLTTPPVRGLRLKDVENDEKARAFCGATAIAAITGEPMSKVKDAIRLARFGMNWVKMDRIPVVKGVYPHHAELALRYLGYEGFWVDVKNKPTLAAWLENRERMMKDYPCLVIVSNHFVAISGHTFCDTFSKGQVVDAEDAPRRRKRVERVYIIQYRVPAQEIPTKLPAAKDPVKRAERNAGAKDRNAFRRYLARMGATSTHDRYDNGIPYDVIVTFADGRKKLGIGVWWSWEDCVAKVRDYLEDPHGSDFDHDQDDEIVWVNS
jgi:hypothetical protein